MRLSHIRRAWLAYGRAMRFYFTLKFWWFQRWLARDKTYTLTYAWKVAGLWLRTR